MTPHRASTKAGIRAAAISILVLASAGCHWARPVTYSIEPGISSSFTPSQLAGSTAFAKTFCSVLEAEFAKDWGPCNNYVRMPSPYQPESLGAIPSGWILLRLGGFGAQCLANTAEAFEDAGQHLEGHGVAQYHVPLGAFETSEQNAARIRTFVQDLHLPATAKLIVVAHSKGAADMMVALTSYPDELKQVRALITVAGAIGGSWLVDRLQDLNQNLLQQLSLPTCAPPRSGPNAIDSMRRANRQLFLAQHEYLAVPSFSISAVSTEDNTSKILQGLWRRVAPYALEQDSHIVEREAIVPGGVFLGRALGDHWAVAFPFDPNPKVKASALRLIDHNRFPREALIEAAVREALKTAK